MSCRSAGAAARPVVVAPPRGTRPVALGATAAGSVATGAAVTATAVVVAVVLLASPALAAVAAASDPGAAVDRGAEPPWKVVLRDVVAAGQRTTYVGELQVVAYDGDGAARSQDFEVRNDGLGTVTLRPVGRTTRLAEGDGDLVHHAEGWFAPVPVAARTHPAPDLDVLAGKYEVVTAGGEQILDRPATRVDIRRRGDGRLCERLWVDTATGLVVRRETYDGDDRLLGRATFVTLDVSAPADITAGRGRAARASRGRMVSLEHRGRTVSTWRLDALAEAGWTVPETLPAGYAVRRSYAVDSAGSPLHLVYDDGLYTVSLFEQRGHPDWSSLPPGARRSDLLDGPSYEWPGAVPRRLVWQADGTTYSLVGDAPPGEFAAIARALPQPEDRSLARRLGHGLRKLLAWVSPWDENSGESTSRYSTSRDSAAWDSTSWD